jgi:hypothetical protein
MPCKLRPWLLVLVLALVPRVHADSLSLAGTFARPSAGLTGVHPPPDRSAFMHWFGVTLSPGIFPPPPLNLTLTLPDGSDVIRQTASSSFLFVEPAPEPTTLVLLGTGLVAIALVKMRKRK